MSRRWYEQSGDAAALERAAKHRDAMRKRAETFVEAHGPKLPKSKALRKYVAEMILKACETVLADDRAAADQHTHEQAIAAAEQGGRARRAASQRAAIAEWLSSQPAGNAIEAKEIAERFGCSLRTAYRAIELDHLRSRAKAKKKPRK